MISNLLLICCHNPNITWWGQIFTSTTTPIYIFLAGLIADFIFSKKHKKRELELKIKTINTLWEKVDTYINKYLNYLEDFSARIDLNKYFCTVKLTKNMPHIDLLQKISADDLVRIFTNIKYRDSVAATKDKMPEIIFILEYLSATEKLIMEECQKYFKENNIVDNDFFAQIRDFNMFLYDVGKENLSKEEKKIFEKIKITFTAYYDDASCGTPHTVDDWRDNCIIPAISCIDFLINNNGTAINESILQIKAKMEDMKYSVFKHETMKDYSAFLREQMRYFTKGKEDLNLLMDYFKTCKLKCSLYIK